MKYRKLCLSCFFAATSLVGTVFAANNTFSITPNQIPVSMVFYLNHLNQRSATMNFSNAALPAQFSCYFASSPKGLSASFSSNQNHLEFMQNNGPQLASGTNDVKIFSVEKMNNNLQMGSITVNVTGQSLGIDTATIICIMHK